MFYLMLVITIKEYNMIGEGKSQQDRLNEMSDEEKRRWGFLPNETVEEKQKRDEKENPSSDPKAGLGPIKRRIM